MPFIIPIIVAVAMSIGVGGFISIGLGILQRLLAPKPDLRTRITAREALSPRRTVYGFYHGPGVVTYLFSDGNSKILEEIHAFAAHECFKVGDLYLDKLRCFPVRTIDGMVLGGQAPTTPPGASFPFRKLATYRYKTGALDNTVYNATGLPLHGEHNVGTGAFPVQASNFEFISECVGNGIAAIYVALHRSDHYNGLPSIAIDLWGKKIYDPRDLTQVPTDSGSWKWSDNPALCFLDYLTTARLNGGLGATLADCDLNLFIAAANVCDETVSVLPAATTIYSIDATGVTNQYQIIVNDGRGLFPGMTISVGGESTTIDSMAGGNAFICLLGSPHPVGDSVTAAGGTEKRYTCNGYFAWDLAPAEIITQLLSSMGGTPTYIDGKFGVYAAAWRPPAVDAILTDADARGPLKVQTLRNARDLCNGVRATFINNFQGNWQPDDLPPVIKRINPLLPDTSVSNDYYLAQDNGFRRWKDVQLPFTTSPATGQRLARIVLEQNRRQVSVQWAGKMSCYQFVAPDVLQIQRARFAWSDKTFQTTNTRLVLEYDKNRCPYFGVDLTLQETDANVYVFDGEQLMAPLGSSGPPPFSPVDTGDGSDVLSTYTEP